MPCKTTPNLIFWTVAQTGKVTPLVSGPPGCGKSRTVEAFARAMSRPCYT
ncbi:MAG: AAA family ATPase [Thermoguttaceae bacterium]